MTRLKKQFFTAFLLTTAMTLTPAAAFAEGEADSSVPEIIQDDAIILDEGTESMAEYVEIIPEEELISGDGEETTDEGEETPAEDDFSTVETSSANEPTSEYVASLEDRVQKLESEAQLSILLARSDLENLNLVDGPIYVTGHKTPDTDTVGSAIAYAALLKKLGFDAVPAVLGPINTETRLVLENIGVTEPELLEDASGKNLVLVDHGDVLQSADGIDNANVIFVIDHHGTGTYDTDQMITVDSRPLGATATIVWIRYRNYGVEMDPKVAGVLLGSLLSDTSNMKADSVTTADQEAFKFFKECSGITDTDQMYTEMFKASISYEGMTDKEILNSDKKDYESGGKTYMIGCVNAYDEEIARDLANRMKAQLGEAVKESGVDMGFAQISIFHDDISITYLVPSDETASEVLKEAFKNAVFDGTSYVLNPGGSRKKLVVPAISEVLAAHPKE